MTKEPNSVLAFLSVWIGLGTLAVAAAMAIYRPWFTDVTVVVVLWFGSPGAMCLAGLTLWALRKEDSMVSGVSNQRLQAKIAIVMALTAAAVVYLLIMYSAKIEPN